jgi:multidrug efflux system membrane fusion protein
MPPWGWTLLERRQSLRIKWIDKTFACAILVCLLIVPSCNKGGGQTEGQASPPLKKGGAAEKSKVTFPVEVVPVALRSLVFTVIAVGSVDAFEKVQVTARVSGVVDRVLFAEGNLAAVDQILVEIEPERYKLAVESAQAAYDKALAAKADAEAGLKRREIVITQTPGLIPGEELETWRTKVLLAASDVAQTLVALNQAKLNLHDAYVRAPFNGILQTRTVQTGQYVQVGTVLATLIRRDPLLLRFSVPERSAAELRPGQVANFKVRDNEKEYASKIVHVAAAADEGTRMVAVTAEIRDTSDMALRPGAFAEITIPVSASRTAPVIPQIAIRPSERGFIAYVIEKDMAIERILTIGMRTADGQAEVLSGLQPGELLVVRGADALRANAPVKVIKSGEQAPAAPGPKKK